MALTEISIRGAAEHNLKQVDIDIPHNHLVVITGLSGSGKSTLAFDTIYAEGQRKYVESLSAYARQFLEQLQKPEVESIEGLPPTIAIEQRGASHNPRSTVATTTEIYDYLRLLYARTGKPRSWWRDEKKTAGGGKGKSKKPAKPSGALISSQSATQIVDEIYKLPDRTKLMLLAPVIKGKKGHHKEIFEGMLKQGFVRARVDGEVMDLREIVDSNEGTPFTTKKARYQQHTIEAVVDRVVVKHDDLKAEANDETGGARNRVVDSVELALKLADGTVVVAVADAEADGGWRDVRYSEKYADPDHPEITLDELEPRLFSFNSPYGACPACGGLGRVMEFDADLIVPNPSLSLTEGAIEAWRTTGTGMKIYYGRMLKQFCRKAGVSYEMPFKDLPKPIQRVLIEGTTSRDEKSLGFHFEGVIPNLQRRWENSDSEFVKERLSNYLSDASCETCHGSRLREEALFVFLEVKPKGKTKLGTKTWAAAGKSKKDFTSADDLDPNTLLFDIDAVTRMTIEEASDFFDSLTLDREGEQIAEPILKEIKARLGFMKSVGLGYLNLNRTTGTLSGGESQRIRLATQVGSGLVGCCYVLDEPTIGLHQRDNARLIRTLRHLSDIGNTVIVVEHDEDTIRAADWLVDIGPGPGSHGGQVVSAGPLSQVLADPKSLTAQYLSGQQEIAIPKERRKLNHKGLVVKGARQNNLQDVDVTFPLGGIVCVTGVSGSGKSTLVNSILLKAAKKALLGSRIKPGAHDRLNGVGQIDRIIEVDQSPIGRTPRSNPATYTNIFNGVRDLFTKTKEAKIRGYKPGRFSFNVKGGRCEACQGQGTKKIEMHFLPDVFVECDVCKGRRYNRETLEITYRGKNIADVLDMTVEEALEFFDAFPDVKRLLQALNDVGLSYVQLGQASTTLSGGEAQRVKLATELGKRSTGHTLYVLDEPTTGLHFHDVAKLNEVLQTLADAGNTLVIIEHNMDVIKCADWVIDLGPEGGDKGGQIVAQGTPEDVVKVSGSYTGQFLKPHLK